MCLPILLAVDEEQRPYGPAVLWSSAGLNLRTDRPTQVRLRRAVRTVLDRRPIALARCACSNRSPRWVTRSRRSPPSWTL
jgi:hypothetical protein